MPCLCTSCLHVIMSNTSGKLFASTQAGPQDKLIMEDPCELILYLNMYCKPEINHKN